MKKFITLLLVGFVLTQCTQKIEKTSERVVGFTAEKAMVVSARQEASDAGKTIMEQGGNAFDAMIATELALAVVYPVAGNIGGGGFMVYRKANGEKGSIDYREAAPGAATANMYLDEEGNMIEGKSTLGAMAVGIPGTIAAIFEIHEKLGSKPIETLFQPAIDLARNGFVATEMQARGFNRSQESFQKANNYSIPLERVWKAGDTVKFPDLAATLERIRDNGPSEFYNGKTAELIANYVQELGGIITLEDLNNYKAVWREPITFDYKGSQITSMTLPSSGGVCLAQILKAVEPYDFSEIEHNSTQYVQLLTEAERRAYADRAHYLGDSDFVDVPVSELIADNYIQNRMASFSWDTPTPSESLSHGYIPGYESDETTHFSIVDAEGTAVSVTTTLNTGFGSKVFVKDAGFFLNNEMDDFSAKPGVPNVYGLVGSKANSIEPGKRMLSSMTPTIVEKNGKLKMVVGTPGGSTIITSVAQNILNVLEYNMGMQESVNKARFHHQWLPDYIRMEPNGFDSISKVKLKQLGYELIERNSLIIGRVDAILILEDGTLEGGADPRGDDAAAGF